MVTKLADAASESGKNNVAFLSHFILGDLEKCLDVLIGELYDSFVRKM